MGTTPAAGGKVVKFREIFRFELVYQARLIRTWLYFAVLFVVAYLLTRSAIESARAGGDLANSPFVIAIRTVVCNMLWVLMAPAVAGTAAARDVQTRMHPFIYTTPISKTDYLGGRFLAALVLDALILIAVPAGTMVALLLPGVEPEILGPFRPAAYISAYVVIALPAAFVADAIRFSLAALRGRAALSYVGSVVLFITTFVVPGVVSDVLSLPALGKLLDPIGFVTVVGIVNKTWTPIEKNTILIGLQSWMLAIRLLWICIALGILAFTHRRFRFGHWAGNSRSK
jgi:ABC-2 type transport system permease protein